MNTATYPVSMRKHVILLFATCALLSACAIRPPAPTHDVARVSQLASGQSRADVEKIMQRPGRIVNYALKPEETTQIWRYEDHFKSMCLFVTYDRTGKAIGVASFEREPDERGRFGTRISGGC
jgi:hypothetical protein